MKQIAKDAFQDGWTATLSKLKLNKTSPFWTEILAQADADFGFNEEEVFKSLGEALVDTYIIF